MDRILARATNKTWGKNGTVFLFCTLGILSAFLHDSCAHRPTTSSQKELYFGYDREIKGETIVYPSPQSDAEPALLVRSLDSSRFIEWESESLPEDLTQESITFVWMAGIDVNRDSHVFDFFINDKKHFTFSNPLDQNERDWQLQGPNGVKLEYKITKVDRHGDFMGYMFLSLPHSLFPSGRPLRLRVQGESSDSRSWFMIFKHRLEPKLTLFSEQTILRNETQPKQFLRAEIVHLGEQTPATVLFDDQRIDSLLELGLNVIRLEVPAVKRSNHKTIRVNIKNRKFQKADFLLQPVKEKEIYLLHHSHVDIGYTHLQNDVEEIQTKNLNQAIQLAEQTQGYPEGSQFKWNTEVMWPVENFMRLESPESRRGLIEAVQKGWIGLDALYVNELTGLCRPEELMLLLESAQRASGLFGVKSEAAMITDIPGFTWGLVPVMAQSGVNYLSIGTNSGHRIGHILSEWADHPFYWVSPSGQEKILCWVHGKGYSWFHTGLGYTEVKNRLQEKPILAYLSELEASGFPYDIIGIRYNIGSDNGPPDQELADTVRAWNEKYKSPRMIIATTAEMFKAFENRYQNDIPVISGDFTGYWEDGAASSARETVLNRQAAERLVQAEILWTLRAPALYPEDLFREAWRNVLLYDEHTWGSWNSISDPESDFTHQQWANKQSYALEAERLSRELISDAAADTGKQEEIKSLDVFNTSSWIRTDLVLIPENMPLAGESVVDDRGQKVSSQRLSTGDLALVVKNVPPFGARRLFFKDKPLLPGGQARAWDTGLSNGLISVLVDETSGAIKSLKSAGLPDELVDSRNGTGLNDYLYVAGRNPEHPQKNGPVTIEILESGPVVASLMISSGAPGCRKLMREVRLIDGIDRVDIINRMDKERIYDPEGVHFAYPFRIPDGVMRLDAAWGVYRPEDDQLPGSCKNYFNIQRWTDVSNQEYGVTWASPDAPLIEVGEIASDPVVFGWKKSVSPSQILYSYVMNNYWETNYKASQEGLVTFRYSIRPHGQFDPAEAEQFGQECGQSLILTPVDNHPPPESFLEVEPATVVVTSLKSAAEGKAMLIRLYNAGSRSEQVLFHWGKKKPKQIYLSSPFGDKGEEVSDPVELPPFGLITLRAEFDKNLPE